MLTVAHLTKRYGKVIAFLENNLRADGSVAIPEPLRMYMGGKDEIK